MLLPRLLRLRGFLPEFPQQSQVYDATGSRLRRCLRVGLARVYGAALLMALFIGSAEASNNPATYIQILSTVSVPAELAGGSAGNSIDIV
jgi:hypothetical protein